MARKKKDPTPEFPDLDATRHKDTRKNIPTEELRDFVAADEAAPPKMLYPRDPSLDPQLIWNGKDEQDREPLEVDVVPIYIQEVIEPRVIIDAIESRRTTKPDNGGFLPGFFDDFEALEFDRKVEFYQHDQHWANRMILGNSLHVMTSLAEKEGLKGKVQMIYIDPPYGIKYGSNWQVSTRKRDVKDGKLEDTSRQPEQIRAFRDTWRIGIHSYLAYLRDRLVVARELLTDAGSIFVQIGDENVHLVRSILDETFGSENIISLISFSKTASTTGRYLPNTSDYVIWYAKDAERMKYRPLYLDKAIGGGGAGKYDQVQLTDNTRRPFLSGERQDPTGLPIGARPFRLDNLTSPRIREARTGYYPVSIKGRSFLPQQGEWKTHSEGMSRLIVAGRVQITGNSLSYVRFLDDFPAFGLSNTWIDIGGIVSNMEPGYRANGRPPSMISQAGLASPKSAQIYPLKPSASGFRERYTQLWSASEYGVPGTRSGTRNPVKRFASSQVEDVLAITRERRADG